MYRFNGFCLDISKMDWEDQLAHSRSFGKGGVGELDENFEITYSNPYSCAKDDFPCGLNIFQKGPKNGARLTQVTFYSPIGEFSLSLSSNGSIEVSELKMKDSLDHQVLSVYGELALRIVWYPLQRALDLVQEKETGRHKEAVTQMKSFLKTLVL